MDEPAIVLSLNETEALATKASRGTGLDWGAAEDLGRAARWLAARGLDWAGPLLGLLNSPAERDSLPALLRAADRVLSPDAGREIAIEPCRPIWALAVLASTTQNDTSLDLRSPDFSFRVSPGGVASVDRESSDIGGATAVVIEAGADARPLAHVLEPHTRRSAVPAAHMDELGRFAARTYVPASAESRRLGAGGGRIDDP